MLRCLTFGFNYNWRGGGARGPHDDCVLALAIAHYIRPQHTMKIQTLEIKGTVSWTEDMWEDYNRASPEAREALIALWGKPKA